MSSNPSWLEELLRGIAGGVGLALGLAAARWRWKRGDRDGAVGDVGLD